MRFYKEILPKIDDIVIGYTESIDGTGINVKLLEYDNHKSYIAFSEVSTRRLRSIRKVIKPGRTYPLLVIAVDEEKGYVDLSNKYITDKDTALEHYANYKHVMNMFKEFCYRIDPEMKDEKKEEYAEKTIWRFARKEANSEFAKIRLNLNLVEEFPLTLEERTVLRNAIVKMYKEPVYTINARFNMYIIGTSGVDRIKTILAFGESMGKEGVDLTITMLTTPTYQVEAKSKNEETAVRMVRDILTTIESLVGEERGTYKFLKFTSSNNLMSDHRDLNRLDTVEEGNEEEDDSEDEDM